MCVRERERGRRRGRKLDVRHAWGWQVEVPARRVDRVIQKKDGGTSVEQGSTATCELITKGGANGRSDVYECVGVCVVSRGTEVRETEKKVEAPTGGW